MGGFCFTFQSSSQGNTRQDYRRKMMNVNHATQIQQLIKPPSRGLAYGPDGDTRYVAMQETHSSNLNLGFSCPSSEKKWRNTVDCAFQLKEGNTYVTTIAIFAEKAEKCEHSSLRTSLAPFCNDATVSLDHVQRGEKVAYLVQQKQMTGGWDRV